jgi:hypothetical protein
LAIIATIRLAVDLLMARLQDVQVANTTLLGPSIFVRSSTAKLL